MNFKECQNEIKTISWKWNTRWGNETHMPVYIEIENKSNGDNKKREKIDTNYTVPSLKYSAWPVRLFSCCFLLIEYLHRNDRYFSSFLILLFFGRFVFRRMLKNKFKFNMRMRNKIYMKEWLSVRLVRYQSSRK